jgi:branched-chain amino acid transport system ATP-binding protein
MTVQSTAAASHARSRPRSAQAARRQVIIAALLVVLAIVLAVLPSLTDNYGLLVAYEVLQLVALGQAWNLMAGYGGLVTLAIAAFVGIGSYTAAKLSIDAGTGFVLAVILGGVVAAAFAAIVALPIFRFRGLYFTIGTLVLGAALQIFMINYSGLGGATGLNIVNGAPTLTTLYFAVLVIAVLVTVVVAFVLRTRLGAGLEAVRDDEDVAQEMGVNTFMTKLFAFTASGFFMGLVGAVQAFRLGRIEPYGAFSLSWTINTVNSTIIGGLGTLFGPVIGGVTSVQLSERLASHPEVQVALTGVLLIIVIRFAPRGIWGTTVALCKDWFAARTSTRPEHADAAEDGSARRRKAATLVSASPSSPIPASGAADGRGSAASQARAAATSNGYLVEAVGLGRAFGGVRAVDSVDIQLRSGEVLGIVGPNGAGKSTFLGLVSGALASDQGTLKLFGQEATSLSPAARARLGVGRSHQVPRPFGQMTVEENLLVAQLHGGKVGGHAARQNVAGILARCGLAEVAQVPASELTLLRLKRLELARALALNPRVLLLDEIGAGLVESEVRELIALLHELKTEVEAMVIVEHVLDVIRETCDRLVVIDRGKKLTEGDPKTVFADPEVVAVYLGTGVDEEQEKLPRHRPHLKETEPVLSIEGIAASYGAFHALEDVSLEVRPGEVVALVGVNGAGKTTTARVMSGLMRAEAGTVKFLGEDVTDRRPHEIVRRGMAHCMEGRQIFGDLSVEENLLVGGRTAPDSEERLKRVRGVYETFPILEEKRADSGKSLSGGQQQMLAVGRALMAAPRLAIFDEISLGLAPVAVDALYEALERISAHGLAMIIIEQNVERGLSLADRVYVLQKGRVALAGTPSEVRQDDRLAALYVGEAKGET